MRSPITGLVNQFHELTVEEQKVFLDLVDPQPEQESQKQTRKKRGKSAKAQSLSSVIAKVPKADSGELCTFILPSNGLICNTGQGYELHHDKGYVDYHPFVPAAQPVAKKSSRKSAGTSSTPSIEGATENALAASSAGD